MFQLGIIGGMGPLATVEFVRRIINYTDANCDQEHIDICVLNVPKIPDRTEAIIHYGISPVKAINKCFVDMVTLGVKSVAIPCNTAHYFVNEFSYPSEINFINLIEETGIFLNSLRLTKKICVLGTQAVAYSKIFNINIKQGVLCYPNDVEQKVLSEIIIKIKSGIKHDDLMNEYNDMLRLIYNRVNGCIFLIACTEISGFLEVTSKYYKCLDTMDILAISSIIKCGYKLNRKNLQEFYLETDSGCFLEYY
ncbi:hypothetical protein BVG16_07715 [Paenibacillus selenitireducens]|uniref:Aspartate racemase n=1 Tax=Paenibacillus selenitireducens TaxID=1324314 RepID=A0A1T2XLA5_9BACL|nr:amino acid racemase [Paenibacillus selenitireducens]OPA80595.1 hypothetical protein BVG16_07715 [Paenibacillus selenitireducens]